MFIRRLETIKDNNIRDIRFWALLLFACILLSILFYNSLFLLVILPFLIPSFKRIRIERKKERLFQEIEEGFRDFLYSLSVSFASGKQMKEAIFEAVSYLEKSYENDSVLLKELKEMIIELKEAGEGTDKIFHDFARKYPLEDIRAFVDVYSTCRSSGADIERAILSTIRVLIEKMDLKKEISVMVSQKKFESKIIGGIPIFIILFLRLSSPDYLEILYSSPGGFFIMTICLGFIILAQYLGERISDIKI